MKTIERLILAFVSLSITSAGWAGPDTNVASVRLSVELTDGSRLIGVPAITSAPIVTAVGKIAVPLAQVTTMTFRDDHEGITVALANGDQLTGVHALDDLRLKGIFGDVVIPISLIRKFDCMTGATARNLPANLREGLVLYYSFDKDEGDPVTDQSPEQNTGTVHGAKWTAQGKVGGAYTFDGSGDYINLPKGGLISGGTFSVFAWIKPSELGRLMLVYVQGRGSYISMRVDTRGKLGCSADGHNVDLSVTTLNADTWYHVGMVYDGNHNAVYVNGVQETRNARTADYTRNMAHIGAGDQNGRPEYHFSGSMDEVMIWNRALSDTEIRQIYNTQQ